MTKHSWDKLADRETISRTITALKKNGIAASLIKTGHDAKQKVLKLIPSGAEVMMMTSTTLDTIGLAQEIVESGRYQSVRKKLNAMDWKTQGAEMKKIGAAPVWAIGSVHAVTEEGQVIIASNTGSQLSAYVYGASHVVWVVGAQKVVKNIEMGIKRVYEYTLLLESERAKKAYGAPGSNVSKLLIVNKEVEAGRITMFIVNEVLGF